MLQYSFKLPDLGEGLVDVEIIKWHVKVGDHVKLDQILLAVETAKSVIDIPSPVEGIIQELCFKVGEVVAVGKILVNLQLIAPESPVDRSDLHHEHTNKDHFSSPLFQISTSNRLNTLDHSGKILATPAVRALAKKLQIDLSKINPTGKFNHITLNDVITAANNDQACNDLDIANTISNQDDSWKVLHTTNRRMAVMMQQTHHEIVPATIFEDLILPDKLSIATFDLTVNLMQAIVFACQQEPAMNAWFIKDQQGLNYKQQIFKQINLGIAIDSAAGLFVPVIKGVEIKSKLALRQELNEIKVKVNAKNIRLEDMQAATFILSNFGKFGGKYAVPVVIAPMVGILAVGKLRQVVVAINNQVVTRKMLPLSLSFDHRAVTGGQATRFLQGIVKFFEQ